MQQPLGLGQREGVEARKKTGSDYHVRQWNAAEIDDFIYATMGYIYRQGGGKALDLRMRTGGKTSQGGGGALVGPG